MEVTPDAGKGPETSLAGSNPSSSSRSLETGKSQTNTSSNDTKILVGNATLKENGTGSTGIGITIRTVKEGKKRAHSDAHDGSEEPESAFSTNAYTGATGVNGMAKAKPAAKKPKLEEGDLRDPPCFKCRESEIPCIGIAMRSSCNACFQHHWRCTTVTPPVKIKKPKNNSISASALNNLLSEPVGIKTTRSQTVGSRSNGTSSRQGSGSSTATPPPSASISAPAGSSGKSLTLNVPKAKKAQVVVPAPSTTPSYLPSDPPVLMLAPPSISGPTLKLGPLGPSSISASTSASTSMSAGRLPRADIPRKGGEGVQRSTIPAVERLKLTKPRKPPIAQRRVDRPKRSKAVVRSRAYIDDSDSDMNEDLGYQIPAPSEEKGKQKAEVKPSDHFEYISELSSPPSSKGSTPDPTEPNVLTFIPIRPSYVPSTEPRVLPTNSNLPAVITTLNGLANLTKAVRTDLDELKKTSATIVGSRSVLDWGIALDKLDKQDKLIQNQSRTIERQGQMISALVDHMKVVMGEKFVTSDFDLGGEAGDAMTVKCEISNRVQVPLGAADARSPTRSLSPATGLLPSRLSTVRPSSQPMPPTIYDRPPHPGNTPANATPVPSAKATGEKTATELAVPPRPATEVAQVEDQSRPALFRTSTTPTPTSAVLGPNGLPPPRATSFMWAQTSNFPRTTSPVSPRRKSSTSSTATNHAKSKSSVSGVPSQEQPKFSKAQWAVRSQPQHDSEEERDELADDSPTESSSQRGWVKSKMMAMK
ncbi:hypothetical protein V5O48_005355 [Marasmius crinis-equi]|uniref:Zn(2)-C6 fungal-type domain-containing protein n=1 Tax=Marasmius crinis-equi TaxID=585013 RepID=A0ABR3FMH3_9AGAR